MDRRQRKTRQAIFAAFTELLAKKNVGRITVGQIIEKADIGRATFYAHFETKEDLLKALGEELFCHVLDGMSHTGDTHNHIFRCEAPEDVYLHLFTHLQKNDNQILQLLSGENRQAFLPYFQPGLTALLSQHPQTLQAGKEKSLPEAYWLDHVASAFVATVSWWQEQGKTYTPEEITRLFLRAVHVEH